MERPSFAEYVPTTQGSGLAEATGQNDPAGQAKHSLSAELLCVGRYVPAGQAMRVASGEPGGQTYPAGQGSVDVLPGPLQNDPAVQSVQFANAVARSRELNRPAGQAVGDPLPGGQKKPAGQSTWSPEAVPGGQKYPASQVSVQPTSSDPAPARVPYLPAAQGRASKANHSETVGFRAV